MNNKLYLVTFCILADNEHNAKRVVDAISENTFFESKIYGLAETTPEAAGIVGTDPIDIIGLI